MVWIPNQKTLEMEGKGKLSITGALPRAGPHVSWGSRRWNPRPRGFQKTEELSRHEARVCFMPRMAAILL